MATDPVVGVQSVVYADRTLDAVLAELETIGVEHLELWDAHLAPDDGEDALTDESVLERLADTYDGFRDDIVMERDPASGKYILSDRGEADIAKRGRLFTLGLLVAGIVFVTTGAVFFGLAATQYGLF